MTVDALTTITHLINSPLRQLAAGGVLAGIVWKFFERVENLLSEQTKLEIAVWLLQSASSSEAAQWQERLRRSQEALERLDSTMRFVALRDWLHKVLEAIGLTDKSFRKTWKIVGFLTCGLALVSLLQLHSIGRQILAAYTKGGGIDASNFFSSFLFTSLFAAMGTHLALLMVKMLSDKMAKSKSLWRIVVLLGVNLLAIPLFALLGIVFLSVIASFDPQIRQLTANWSDRAPEMKELGQYLGMVIRKTTPFQWINAPMMFVSGVMALLLAASLIFRLIMRFLFFSSGALLKAARRFDIGFDWFNRHFDIEKKPLQSIGLVAGALVAMVYWAAVIVSRIVG
jgi:hypothetical protein